MQGGHECYSDDGFNWVGFRSELTERLLLFFHVLNPLFISLIFTKHFILSNLVFVICVMLERYRIKV